MNSLVTFDQTLFSEENSEPRKQDADEEDADAEGEEADTSMQEEGCDDASLEGLSDFSR